MGNALSLDSSDSGIREIMTNANAEAVYYDLRGMRVANPVSGTIYIVVRNGKATKELFK